MLGSSSVTPQSRRRAHLLWGKSLVILAVAWLFARSLTDDAARDYARGEALTREAYAAEYEAYRAELMDDTDSFGFNLAIAIITLFGLAGVYEVAGEAAGRALGSILPRRHAGPAPTSASTDRAA